MNHVDRLFSLTLCCALTFAAHTAENAPAEEGWVSIFNGKNLDGGTRIPATFTDSGQRSRRPMIVPPG